MDLGIGIIYEWVNRIGQLIWIWEWVKEEERVKNYV